MTNGISALREGKAKRASRQVPPPRHPVLAEPPVSPAGDARTTAKLGQVQSDRPEAPVARPVSPAGDARTTDPNVDKKRSVPSDKRALPDLNIDWSDPLMHVPTATRVSVPHSVASRFKAAAEQPGQAPQTELILEAVSQHLAQLPELVLGRRPQEAGAAQGFYVKRATPAAEPWRAIYMRPLAGETQALGRIVEWVNTIIRDRQPGRAKCSRSEIVAAALDATYPE